MLLTGHRLLDVAKRHRFAVPAFNISDWAMCQGIFEINEQLQAPLVIAIHPDELSHIGVDLMPAIIQRAYRSSVPVVVHLDHGTSIEQIQVAIQAGFTSVMIDGSMLPFAENVALTRHAARAAHAVGLSVEAELGTIGRTDLEAEANEANANEANANGTSANSIVYTDPDEAVRFVEQTGVDSLAVAIGTCHGIYPSWMKPEIRLDLLQQISSKVAVPLVLHGGSANPDAEIAEAVTLGISKINISSDIKVAYHATMRQVLRDLGLREPNEIQPPCVQEMQATAAHKIRLLRAEGQAVAF